MLTSQEVINFLKENKPIFQSKYYCEKIGLFGSFARNEQSKESDIDILVTYKDDVPDFIGNELALKNFISQRFQRKVDICPEKWIKPIFKPLVLSETIYA